MNLVVRFIIFLVKLLKQWCAPTQIWCEVGEI